MFSHLPLPVQPNEIPSPEELVFLMESSEVSPITVKQIKALTDQDQVLATVRRFVKQGWPKSVQHEFRPYHSRKLKLSIQEDCVLWSKTGETLANYIAIRGFFKQNNGSVFCKIVDF